jgi:hypothetical protein
MTTYERSLLEAHVSHMVDLASEIKSSLNQNDYAEVAARCVEMEATAETAGYTARGQRLPR